MRSQRPLPWRSKAASSTRISLRRCCSRNREHTRLAWSVSLAAKGILLSLVRFATPQEERRNSVEETDDISEVPNERNELNADQPNVTGASDKEIGSAAYGECAPEIEKEK